MINWLSFSPHWLSGTNWPYSGWIENSGGVDSSKNALNFLTSFELFLILKDIQLLLLIDPSIVITSSIRGGWEITCKLYFHLPPEVLSVTIRYNFLSNTWFGVYDT